MYRLGERIVGIHDFIYRGSSTGSDISYSTENVQEIDFNELCLEFEVSISQSLNIVVGYKDVVCTVSAKNKNVFTDSIVSESLIRMMPENNSGDIMAELVKDTVNKYLVKIYK